MMKSNLTCWPVKQPPISCNPRILAPPAPLATLLLPFLRGFYSNLCYFDAASETRIAP
jgi:hypothetical protein